MYMAINTTPKRTTNRPESSSQPELLLVSDSPTAGNRWQLDDRTKEIGRKGLAEARAALKAARPAHLDLAA